MCVCPQTAILDVFYGSIFLCALFILRQRFAQTLSQRFASKLSIGRFTVQVSRLPPGIIATQDLAEELKGHFEGLYGEGSVAEVSVVSAGCAVLDDISALEEAVRCRRRFASLINRSRGLSGAKRYDRASLQAEAARARVRARLSAPAPAAAAAFVTFERAAARGRCLDEHGASSFSARLRRLLLSAVRRENPDLLFRGEYPLRIREAPEPNCVLWCALIPPRPFTLPPLLSRVRCAGQPRADAAAESVVSLVSPVSPERPRRQNLSRLRPERVARSLFTSFCSLCIVRAAAAALPPPRFSPSAQPLPPPPVPSRNPNKLSIGNQSITNPPPRSSSCPSSS